MANTTAKTKDWLRLDLDPVTEVSGSLIVRKYDRKLEEYKASRVTFFKTIVVMLECMIPLCTGHQKFGVIVDENIPVIFKRHDKNEEAIYVRFKNPICNPLRMPESGDKILSGIRWRTGPVEASILSGSHSSMMDCLLANLRFRMLLKEFCLDCLFMHTNGMGLMFERLLKTILNHLFFMGRICDKESYKPVTSYNRSMELRIKRVWWSQNEKAFRHVCCDSNKGLKEGLVYMDSNLWLFNNIPKGVTADPSQGVMRWLNTVSKILVTVRCGCEGGAMVHKEVYTGLLRKNRRNDLYSIVLAEWDLKGDEYEDPIWNWSMFGPELGSKTVVNTQVKPVCRECVKCKGHVNIHNIRVPETTWLFMANMSEILQKGSVDGIKKIGTYVLGGVPFYLAFVVLYNIETGQFTSMNTYEMWRFFDDSCGGLFKYCNPNKVKYQERWNLRAFYYRRTPVSPHRCVVKAAGATNA
jgi:hypothetical protein